MRGLWARDGSRAMSWQAAGGTVGAATQAVTINDWPQEGGTAWVRDGLHLENRREPP